MPRPMPPKIGVSGVRGIVGESLTPQLVTSFAAAFGNYCGAGPILIGTDSRPSREMVKQAAIAGLLSVGCTPVDAGIVPLPALMLHVRQAGAFGAIFVSASHNPIEWNALKFIGSDGIVLRPNQSAELADLYHQGVYSRVGAQDIADGRVEDSTVARHRDAVLRVINADAIRSRKFKVAVDCCNGAASLASPAFLRALGCEVIELNTRLDRSFPHNPEPLPENIVQLCELVKQTGAHVGFAQDADADRLAVVNECGEPLGEDCTVALAVDHWLSRRKGPIVVSASTSRMVDDIAARHGVPVFRTRVGEIHVVERMLECGAEIGGEGNGGVILREVNPCRDSFIGMALLLEALAEEGVSVSELRARIPKYAMVRDTLLCPARDIAPLLRLLQNLYRNQKLDFTDGVKVLWPDRWLHARPSNTELIIRIIAEAPTEPEARTLLLEALECLSPST
ncbi:MAG TPA: phosphoglucosamine mutase [Acidobacteriota bacterium]|nr:phosphoglucosamine mutase [Acidobacteriota bacterium]